MEFPVWVKNFETFVNSKANDEQGKLAYLNKYTRGEAKGAIKMLIYLDSEGDCYTKAMSILRERFGGESIIVDAYTRKLTDWPPIPHDDGPALVAFSDFLQCCLTARKSTSLLSFLDDPREQRKLLIKLPYYIIKNWRDIVVHYNPSNSNTPHSGKYHHPSFESLCNLIQLEAKKASNPFVSDSALIAEECSNSRNGTKVVRWKPRDSNTTTKYKLGE